MWRENNYANYQDHTVRGSTDEVKQNKRVVFEDSDDEVSPTETGKYTDRKMHRSLELSSQSDHRKKPNMFDDDDGGDEFGYSKAEMMKLKAASTTKGKRVTFDDYQSDDTHSSESETDDSEDELEESDSENSENDNEVHDYSEMTMEQLLNLQEEMGTRAFREKVLKVQKPEVRKPHMDKTFKRLNKNRPSEMPLMRKTAPRMNFLEPGKKTKKKLSRDPRFDDLSGSLQMNLWDKRYEFLKSNRKREMEILANELKEEENLSKKKKIKLTLQRMQNQEREGMKREREQSVKRLQNSQQRDALRLGKKPKFMSEKEKKLMLKTMHFEQLKKENKVGKYLERKEKKQLQRERKTAM